MTYIAQVARPLRSALLVLASLPILAAAQAAPPLYVVNDVRLVDQPDAPRVSLVLRDGRIAGILEEPKAQVPGARRIDGKGFLALPAFVDAYTFQGVEPPELQVDRDQPVPTDSDVRVEMRSANRKGIRPAFLAADVLSYEKDALEPWRKAGFGVVHVTPRGELLAGNSAVVTARDAAPRDLVLRPVVFQSAAFEAGGGRGYPGTLMGYHAQLRQFLYDSGHHALLQQRRAENKPGLRPPYDRDLEAAFDVLRGERALVCLADGKTDIARWLSIAEEFGLKLVVAGGREAHELVGQLAQRKVPVLLTLDWGKEVPDPDAKKKRGDKAEKTPETDEAPQADEAPEADEPAEPETTTDAPSGESPAQGPAEGAAAKPERAASTSEAAWEYEEPLEVRRERRRQWEKLRKGALRLHEGGVRLAFGTGEEKPGELLKRVRTLVEQGLPEAAALDALTRGAAEVLGVGDRVGRIEVGYDAHLVLWTASPFDEEARVAWAIIDGVPQQFEVEPPSPAAAPAEGADASGSWTLVFEGARATEPTRLVLAMTEEGAVEGTIRVFSPFAAEEVRGAVQGSVSGTTLRLAARLNISGFDAETTLTGELEEDRFEGEVVWSFSQGEQTARFTATRDPKEGSR